MILGIVKTWTHLKTLNSPITNMVLSDLKLHVKMKHDSSLGFGDPTVGLLDIGVEELLEKCRDAESKIGMLYFMFFLFSILPKPMTDAYEMVISFPRAQR